MKYVTTTILFLVSAISLFAEGPVTLVMTKIEYQQRGNPIFLEVGQNLDILEPLPDNPQLSLPTFSSNVLHLNACGRTVRPERNWAASFTAIAPGETTVQFGNDTYVVDVISIDSDINTN